MQTLKVTHHAGFFSCCSVLLHHITRYVNLHKNTPDCIDSSSLFAWYKPTSKYNASTNKIDISKEDTTSIMNEYFENVHENLTHNIRLPINYHENHQYIPYDRLDFNNLNHLIKMYFSPSSHIKNIISELECKYKLEYDKICVLFYRGNDKCTETLLCNYDEYTKYANDVLKREPNTIFLIQSDETEFIDYFSTLFPKNSFYFKDEIRHITKNKRSTVDKCNRDDIQIYSKYYLAITFIMSKCRTIICGSGNCSIWIALFRGNCKNVIQFLHGKWYMHAKT